MKNIDKAHNSDVVIIGGGIIGLFSAYYLQKSGVQVTIVDQIKEQKACSFGNAGLVVPSHYVPLAAPGMISKGIKWMFSSKSPFAIRPKLKPSFYSWLWQFTKASSPKQVEKSLPLIYQMNLRSSELYDDFVVQEKLAFDYKNQGLIMLCNSENGFKEEQEVAAMGESLGVKTELWSAEKLKKEEPNLEIDVEGALYYPGDSHMNPDKLMESLNQLLLKMGVNKIEGEVRTVRKLGNKVRTLLHNGEEIHSTDAVITAGVWSEKLLWKMGIRLALLPGKGYSLTLNNPSQQAKRPMIFSEAKVAVTPMGDSLRFAGTMELGEMGLHIKQGRVDGIKESVPNYFPQFEMSDFNGIAPWCGLRPCTPDGLPFIGPCLPFKNIYLATGHAMMGLSMAPVTGKMISDMINENQMEIETSALAVDRF